MFELVTGPILAASWLNSPLMALELYELIRYFKRFPNDFKPYQIAVVLAVLIDIATVISVMAAVWLYSITNWGDAIYATSQPWPIPFYCISTGFSAMICQLYLIWRIYKFTKAWFWLPLLIAPVLASLLGAIQTGYGAITITLAGRATLTKWVTVWLSGKAGADIIIAAVSIYNLRKVKAVFEDSRNIIRRLIIQAVETGSITALLAIAALILYNILPETNTSIMIAMDLGRVYTITMLVALNRRQVDQEQSTQHSSSMSRGNIRTGGFGTISNRADQMASKGGINVERQTEIHFDETPDHFEQVQPAAVVYRARRAEPTSGPLRPSDFPPADFAIPQGGSEIELAREPLRHN